MDRGLAARGGAVASRAGGRGAGDGALRDASGEQPQIDFGEKRVVIGGEPVPVHLFVATLGYPRDCYSQLAHLAGIFGACAERSAPSAPAPD